MKLNIAAVLAPVLLCACAVQPKEFPVVASKKSPVELRAMQSRAFDTRYRPKTVRAVIATLQDLRVHD